MVSVRYLDSNERLAYLEQMAELRIAIFSTFPYLYDGSLDYEKAYLKKYCANTNSCVVGAFDQNKLIGMSTAIILGDAEPEFKDVLGTQNIPLDQIVYFGESLLQPNYRGQGIGHKFFELREKFANKVTNLKITAFCAVERDQNDHRKPVGYKPLDEFWLKKGYQKQPHLKTSFEWKEVGSPLPTKQVLTFWMKKWKK